VAWRLGAAKVVSNNKSSIFENTAHSRFILLADSVNTDNGKQVTGVGWCALWDIHNRHLKKAQLLFGDGHGEAQKRQWPA